MDLAKGILTEGIQRLKGQKGDPIESEEKYLIARWVRSRTKVGVKWLAKELGMNAGTWSHGIWKMGWKIEKDRRLKNVWKMLQN